MEGHGLAQTVAYGDLANDNPSPITPEYKRQAEPVIEIQLEKAGIRLAYLLNAKLMHSGAAQNLDPEVHKALSVGNPGGSLSPKVGRSRRPRVFPRSTVTGVLLHRTSIYHINVRRDG